MFSQSLVDLLNLAVTLSMAATPFLVLFNEKVIQHFQNENAPPEFDRIDEPGNPVIIAGFGRFGQVVRPPAAHEKDTVHGAGSRP